MSRCKALPRCPLKFSPRGSVAAAEGCSVLSLTRADGSVLPLDTLGSKVQRGTRLQTGVEGPPRARAWVCPQDDIIDDVESFVAAAEILKERGAYRIYVMATHGILSAEAPRLIEESSIDEVCLLFLRF